MRFGKCSPAFAGVTRSRAECCQGRRVARLHSAARWHLFGAKGAAFIAAWGNAQESGADIAKALKARFNPVT
jgi:hypothetical protein